jgi:hypothetical protein
MARASVTDCLERAREIAALADKKLGDDRKRLLEIAEAWLKLAEDSALEATKSAAIAQKLTEHAKAQ